MRLQKNRENKHTRIDPDHEFNNEQGIKLSNQLKNSISSGDKVREYPFCSSSLNGSVSCYLCSYMILAGIILPDFFGPVLKTFLDIMNCKFCLGWRYSNQRLLLASGSPLSRSLLSRCAPFQKLFSVTWRMDFSEILTLIIM